MKKNISKRILSAFLALIMVFLLIPFCTVAVTAAEENDYSVPTTKHKLLSSYNVLSGTDISAEGAATAMDIFNRDKLDELIKKYASYDPRHGQYGEERKGDSMESFVNSAGFSISQSMGMSVGMDKLFKASAEAKFKLSGEVTYSEALEMRFFEYAITVQKGYYRFDEAHIEEVRDFSNGYLSDTFINALTGADGSTPEEFFEKYGTHIITSYTAGGTAGVYSSTVKTAQSADVSLDVMYGMGLGGSGTVEGVEIGGQAAMDFALNIKGESDKSNCYTKTDTYAHGGQNAICFKDGVFNYESWVNSMNADNATILLDEHLKMVPIWDLLPVIGYEERLLELTLYYMNVLEEQDSKFYAEFAIDETQFDYSNDWMYFENCRIITNEEELYDIRNDLNGVYVLGNNIVLSKYADWTPIGTKENPFRGRLYGNNNVISGLDMSSDVPADSSGNIYIGLFANNSGLITDLKISGSIDVHEDNTANAYIGSIAAYNNGIINNCFDDVIYNVDRSSISHINLPVEKHNVEADKTYSIGTGVGIHLVGEQGTTYSNVNIVVKETNSVGPIYIILDNVNIVGDSENGTIYNPTSRKVYIISRGESNTIAGASGAPGSPAINSPHSDLFILGETNISILGGDGNNGGNGYGGNNYGQNGKDGYDGGAAIIVDSLVIDVVDNDSAVNVSLSGGNGGNGGSGGTGWWDAGDGHGGHGGSGGHAGSAVISNSAMFVNGRISIFGGNGGNGGNGGTGENMLLDPGHGGNGGNGGDAGYSVTTDDVSIWSDAVVYCITGVNGKGGAGGNGEGSDKTDGVKGSAGTNKSPKASVYIASKKYILYDTTKKWGDAKANAESLGGHLVTIKDEKEWEIVKDLMQYGTINDYYIGGYRVSNGWAWVTGEPFSFVIWTAGEPNNSGGAENYLGIFKDKSGCNDYPDVAHGYIEEYDLTVDDNIIPDHFTGIIAGNNSKKGKMRNSNSSAWNDNPIQIDSLSKTEYFSGDKFDVNSVDIRMYDKLISDYGTAFDSSCRGFSLSKMGYITVTKDNFVRYIPAHVTKTVPEYIEIVNLGKTEFAVSETFDISGIVLNVVYNNGSQQRITEKDVLYTVPSTEYVSQGEKVVVTYQESGLSYNTSYEITVVEDVVESIFIQTRPIKLTYQQGEKLLLDGLQVYECRKSGKKVLMDNQYLIIEVSPSLCTVGTSTVTIKHPGNTEIVDTFTVKVEANNNFDHPWDEGTVISEPTHTSEGTIVYQCTVDNCNATKTESIPTIEGHSYGDWYKLNDTQHQRSCECGDVIVMDHTWDAGVITIPATHLTVGESLYTCTVCDATETRVIEKNLDHDFQNWVRCDDLQHARSCECGKTEYQEHSWDAGTVTVEPTYVTTGLMTHTCEECKATVVEVIPALEVPGDAPYIVVDSKKAIVNDTVIVKISLKDNPGITSMRIKVMYDSSLLEITKVEYNSAMGGQSVLPENIETVNGVLMLYWANGFVNYTKDDVFVALTFNVLENASGIENSVISVTYDQEDIFDADENNVLFVIEDGIITFEEYIPGDINGDGIVNTKDTTRLMRYLAGWDVTVNENALDVNGDVVVNTKDTTRLMRYLAGWEVEIY